MTFFTDNFLRRAGALLTAVLLLFCHVPYAALATNAEPPLVFTLTWLQENMMYEYASVQAWEPGYENSYWLYVTPDAIAYDAAINVRDVYSQYAFLSLPAGLPLSQAGFVDAADLGSEYLPVYAYNANSEVVAEYRLYLSTQSNIPIAPAYTPEPMATATPEPAPVETFVPVYYYDHNGNYIAENTALVRTGENTVWADPNHVPGYNVEGSANVTVDAYGNCNPASVTFYCTAQSVETFVPVYYYDHNGNYIAENTAPVRTGENTVWADPNHVPGYNVEGSANVTVDAYGNCTPNSVTFYCTAQSVETFVPVYYYDHNGNYIAENTALVRTGENTVWADPNHVPGYNVEGSANVTVDAYGNCNPASVTFYCTAQSVETFVPVYYYDHNGNYIAENTALVRTGENTVWADPNHVPGYNVEGSANVTVDAYGNCNPASVTFYCTAQSVETFVPVYYYDHNGNYIAENTALVRTGENTVWADPNHVPGYNVEGSAKVTVDAYGNCNPASVTFYCTAQSVETFVPVYYYDHNGNYIAENTALVRTGENTVWADPNHVPGYNVEGSANVTVDAYGNCNPASVTFYCTAQSVETFVPVYYYDQNGNYITESMAPVRTGENVVWADLTLAPEYILNGEGAVTVWVDAFGVCTPANVTFYLALPAQPTEPPVVETPVLPAETPVPAQAYVTVRYVNARDEEIYSEKVLCQQGDTSIAPQSGVLTDGYTLENDIPVVVHVDAQGIATPGEVTFRCQGGPPEATPQPVDVIVYYLNDENEPVASATTTTCYEGITPVRPAPVDLMENYVLKGEGVQYVVVNEKGAEPATVTFYYTYQAPATQAPTAPPAPKVALVPVVYRTTIGEVFYTDNTVTCTQGVNTVTPNAAYVPAGYQLRSADSVSVTVDEAGVAMPASVEFVYFTGEVIRDITVYYKDLAGNDVASPQTRPCYLGANILANEPIDLRAGYRLISPETQTVMLDENGVMTVNGVVTDSVIFSYEAPPTPTPQPTTMPYQLHPMKAYCYPKSDTINFRSAPSTASDESVIRVVGSHELGVIEGYIINERNEQWYVVTIGEQTGFLRENVVRLLTDDEVNALFGYTPTPAPTAIPDFAPIDRWGQVNDRSVNFRASIGGERITSMAKGTHIFIYDAETRDGDGWYRANLNGRDGYVMAEFVDLLSESDSQAYQQTLASPMPVRTPEPTQTPVPVTATPTAVVTPTPSPTPTAVVTASPTPAPYTGYALTTRAVDLRTGVTIGDTTLATLPANSLVYLWGQAYIDGVCWHSAESLQMNISGYLTDDVLRRITSEEAALYLAALQPQMTATPAPTAQPAPYTGYAVTNGNNVLLRAYSNTSAEIIEVLTAGEVVWVLAQEYVEGEAWQIVRFKNIYGYIRNDQLRMMSYEEQLQYEETLRTATPAPQATPTIAPITQESLSSYGYVTTNNVRLRSGAGTAHNYIRMMNQYAFALVLGSEDVSGKTWYHINQAGTEGYVLGDYFKVLTMGELTEFLTSDEYLQSEENTQSNTGGNTGNTITSPEDFNVSVNWQTNQPVQVTYNPFMNPLVTVTPTVNVEQIATPTPTVAPSVLPTTNFQPFVTPEPNATGGSGSGWIWLALAGLGVIAGGGVYAYSIHRQNQRRAAQRAAQRRAQQQQAARNSAYQRPQQQYPQQQAQNYQSPFTPPQPRSTDPTAAAGGQSAPEAQSGNASAAPRRRRSDRHQG